MLTYFRLEKPRPSQLNLIHLLTGLLAAIGVSALLIPGLGAWSMWLDEINMVNWARTINLLDPATLAQRTGHPPFYLLLLAGWQHAAGLTDFSMRLLSVFSVILGAIFIYRTIVDITRQPLTGLGIALIMAAMPYTRYYAHEAHNYGLFLGLAAAVIFFYQRWWRHYRQRDLVIGLGGSLLLILYTHYFSLFLVLALNLHALWLLFTQRRPQWFAWIRWQALVGIAYLPWVGIIVAAILKVLNRPRIPHMAGRGVITGQRTNFQTIINTIHVMLSGQEMLYGLLLVMGIGGLIWLHRKDRRQEQRIAWLVVLGLVVLVGGFAFGMGFNFFLRSFLHRRVIFLIVGIMLGAAGAIAPLPVLLRRVALVTLFIATLSATIIELPGDWQFRQAIEQIKSQVKPGDLVYVQFETSSIEEKPLAFYASTLLPAGTTYYSYIDQDFANTEKIGEYARWDFGPHVLTHDRFWAVTSTDPNIAPTTLDWVKQIKGRSYVQTKQTRVGWMLVTLFTAEPARRGAFSGAGALPSSLQLPAQFGDNIQLDRLQIGATEAHPGDSIPILLDWLALGAPGKDYAVYIHLRGADQIPVAQVDSDPHFLDVVVPTSLWSAGGIILDQHTLVVGPDVSPGTYDLVIGLYDRATLARLPVRSAAGTISDGLLVARITVLP